MTKQELIELRNKLLETYDEENIRQVDSLKDLEYQIKELTLEELKAKRRYLLDNFKPVGTAPQMQNIIEVCNEIVKLQKELRKNG